MSPEASTNPMLAIPKMRRVFCIHFIGIGGAGMSGIAEVLLNQGYQITGSDLQPGASTRRLEELGIKITIGHTETWVEQADAAVVSSAIADDNVELMLARKCRVPIVTRAEMLAELMRFRYGIAITGSHGKTTTTSLLAHLFEAAGMDPTFVIGGLLKSAGVHARLGESRYMVAEADESDASFLHLQPMVAVMTNLDREHLSTLPRGFETLDEVFLEFLHNLPFYGLAVLCGDDAGIRRILPQVPRKFLTYGFNQANDFRVSDYEVTADGCRFKVARPDCASQLTIELPLLGRHNALNALAAIAVASDEGITEDVLISACATFSGVERRCELHANIMVGGSKVDLIDDYGHHPTELMAVITALREAHPKRRIVMVFQLHRYSRTRDCYDDFVKVLGEPDMLIMLDIYAAGEAPIPGIDVHSLCASIRQHGKLINPIFAANMDAAFSIVSDIARPNDLVITQGAGDIAVLKNKLLGRMEDHDHVAYH